jgi:tetratricopeptide (TPR) repeat protein
MKFLRSLAPLPRILCALTLFLILPGSIHAKDTWMSVKSENFTLVGNASEKEIKQVATRLEQFREVFSQLFPHAKLASGLPTTVVVFKSNSAFKPYKPLADGKVVEVAGYFQSGRDVNYIALSTERMSEETLRIIFHECVHLLVNNTFGKATVPPWFNEGLAEYYSTFEIDGSRKVFLGNPIANHIHLLRSTKLMSLPTLFGVDYYSLDRNGHDARGVFYAQSWLLIHYLLQRGADSRQQLTKFLDLLIAQKPVEQAFREAFKSDYATFEKELERYVKKASYRIDVATFERKLEFDDEMSSSPLTEAQAQAYLGDLLNHINRRPEAITKLREALALDPDLSIAHASLGAALVRDEKYAEALNHLAKAVTSDATSYLAHFYYAYALSRRGMNEDLGVTGYSTEDAASMRTALAKSIKANPDFAESYSLLAFVNLVTNQNLNEAVEQINKAIKLSPGDEQYVFILAQIQMRRSDFNAARKIMVPLANSSSDSRIRATAEGMLKSIASYEKAREEFDRAIAKRREEAANGTLSSAPQQTEVVLDHEASLEDALRKPVAGQLRVLGRLKRIECTPKAITFTLQVGEQSLRFSTIKFDDLTITSFTTDVSGELTCGARKAPEHLVLTYVPVKDAKANTDGTAVALEFVPKDFSWRNN